ncbi:MAG: Chaperone protein DnaJ [Candidatus Gottesmanbacteria bacterium GW2011_GWB1_44_11c]|uniref:Chaperone protein DnaJ n=2 Tax=Candidatus Gottesmaniibacteriota TaxID=1752720 RepID=A0A0G1KWQ8_9BACT|nr:MAG: Chaperone protein DnaJ [Candidatus Gottesmanbacteria bacterium GW2011_GWB1_44_11c]KKT60727.1 MAG: Chaperone protein DnaJ [Candidatus Gottesmanbacteria bacterium GW2011_GWA1_44_24b]HCM82259.1 molecular chaperone DnaJ [Patescibacteria group bacterium]
MATKRDYYDILGISKSASDMEIKRAYRKLALEWHPDRNKAANANEKFKEINEAYAVLSSKDKRSAYDQFGHSAFAPGGGMGAGGQGPFGGFRQQGPFSYTYSTNGFEGGSPFGDFIDPFEIFEQFFGGGFSGARGRTRREVYEISISFDEAIKGVTKEVMLPRGRAGEGSEKRTIKIPAGVDTGSRIRFDDFDIVVAVKKDRTFQRQGDDLIKEHELSYAKAALGGVEEIETVEGPVKIHIQPGTQPGTLIRLRGKGAPHVHGAGNGDLYIKIQIHIPTHLSRRQKELLSELENE